MPNQIVGMDGDAVARSWTVQIRKQDGAASAKVFDYEFFLKCGNHLLGQIMLQCFLGA